MTSLAKRVIACFTDHPHTLFSGVVGFGLGMLAMLPLGWRLPDATASLIGAMFGAAAAVSGALWAANAKQRQEDARADEKQRHLASMIAVAVIPEIVGARRNFVLIANRLDAAIKEADKAQDVSGVLGVLGASTLDSKMCERYMDKLEAFGSEAANIVEAVGAILDINTTNPALTAPIKVLTWAQVRGVVVGRSVMARGQADHLRETIKLLARHHPRPVEVEQWADLPFIH